MVNEDCERALSANCWLQVYGWMLGKYTPHLGESLRRSANLYAVSLSAEMSGFDARRHCGSFTTPRSKSDFMANAAFFESGNTAR